MIILSLRFLIPRNYDFSLSKFSNSVTLSMSFPFVLPYQFTSVIFCYLDMSLLSLSLSPYFQYLLSFPFLLIKANFIWQQTLAFISLSKFTKTTIFTFKSQYLQMKKRTKLQLKKLVCIILFGVKSDVGRKLFRKTLDEIFHQAPLIIY